MIYKLCVIVSYPAVFYFQSSYFQHNKKAIAHTIIRIELFIFLTIAHLKRVSV